MNSDTTLLRRCLGALDRALDEPGKRGKKDAFLSDTYRAACLKEFELTPEQSRKPLCKRLVALSAAHGQAKRLAFKGFLRHAASLRFREPAALERCSAYRDNCNDNAHDFGENFTEATLKLIPAFLADTKALAEPIERTDSG